MNSKKILFSLIMIVFALFLISSVGAADNETVSDNVTVQEPTIDPNLEFEQSSDSYMVKKDDIFQVYFSVKNNGPITYNNLTINYPLPEGLKVLISPVEYDGSVWTIDSLYPNETLVLTLICRALVSNTIYEFTPSYGNESIGIMDVICEPDNPDIPVPENNTGNNGLLKSINGDGGLKDAGNPIILLLLMIFCIPLVRFKR